MVATSSSILCQRLSLVSPWNRFRLLYELNIQIRIHQCVAFLHCHCGDNIILQLSASWFALVLKLFTILDALLRTDYGLFIAHLNDPQIKTILLVNKLGHIHGYIFVSVNSAFTAPCISLDHRAFTVKISAKSFSCILPSLSHFLPTLQFWAFNPLRKILQIVILNYSLGINIIPRPPRFGRSWSFIQQSFCSFNKSLDATIE